MGNEDRKGYNFIIQQRRAAFSGALFFCFFGWHLHNQNDEYYRKQSGSVLTDDLLKVSCKCFNNAERFDIIDESDMAEIGLR